jgi:hypothetical protein
VTRAEPARRFVRQNLSTRPAGWAIAASGGPGVPRHQRNPSRGPEPSMESTHAHRRRRPWWRCSRAPLAASSAWRTGTGGWLPTQYTIDQGARLSSQAWTAASSAGSCSPPPASTPPWPCCSPLIGPRTWHGCQLCRYAGCSTPGGRFLSHPECAA